MNSYEVVDTAVTRVKIKENIESGAWYDPLTEYDVVGKIEGLGYVLEEDVTTLGRAYDFIAFGDCNAIEVDTYKKPRVVRSGAEVAQALREEICNPATGNMWYGGYTEPTPTKKKAETAIEFLQEAKETQEERGKDYDQEGGERSARRLAEAFNAVTGRKGDRRLSEADAWLLLQLLKDVRQWTKEEYHHDSALDSVSYAALKAECLAAGGKLLKEENTSA